MDTDATLPPPRRRVTAAEVTLALLAGLFLWPFGVMLSTSIRNDAHRASHRGEWLPRGEYIRRPGGHWREVLQKKDLTREGQPGQVRARIGDWTGRIDKTVTIRADAIRTRLGPTLRPYFHGLIANGFAIRAFLTLTICVVAVVASTFASALAAYAFSILRWPGRDVVFYGVLSALLVPPALKVMPLYNLYRELPPAFTYMPLFLPVLFGNAFFVLLLRQSFLKIPRELIDTARLEGGTEWQVFTGVVLPAARSALAAVAVLAFVCQWGEAGMTLMGGLDPARQTFAAGLINLGGTFRPLRSEEMAMCAVSIVPVALVVFLTRRAWMRGLRVFLPGSLA